MTTNELSYSTQWLWKMSLGVGFYILDKVMAELDMQISHIGSQIIGINSKNIWARFCRI